MKIITIFGQRKESYPGEYAPELIDAVDECADIDNGKYMQDEMEKAHKLVADGEFSFVRRMEFDIDDKEFDKAFYGETIKAKVIKE